jgi:hypothetical protein
MLLLLSGEGPSDLGQAQREKAWCETDEFDHGPLCVMLDKLAEAHQGLQYSLLDSQQVLFAAKQQLAGAAKTEKPNRMRIPGNKHGKETAYYYKNALGLAKLAQSLTEERQQKVVAVLFRDADGTVSSGRGEWQQKWQSMQDGFASANYAVKAQPYQHCAALEQRSGNDDSPHALKAELAQLIGDTSASALTQLVHDGRIDPARIDMPSFNRFKQSFGQALQHAVSSGR